MNNAAQEIGVRGELSAKIFNSEFAQKEYRRNTCIFVILV
jgi:hypothetical protein